jgi:hypothetical protein
MTKRFAVLGLIIALVVSIAAIGCDGGGSAGPTPQPKTATAQPTEQPTQQPTSEPTSAPTEAPNQAATATSLDFTIEYILEGMGTYTYQYRARNIGTSNLDFRVDMTSSQMDAAYILKGSTQQGWVYSGGQWFEFTTMYQNWDEFWDAQYEGFEEYHAALVEDWTGVEGWSYTMPGVGSVTYTNVNINPSLPDSVFQP